MSYNMMSMRLFGTVLTLLVLYSAIASTSSAFDGPLVIHEGDEFRHPANRGLDLTGDITNNGSLLLLVGYVRSDDVRVVDRNMTTIAVLEDGSSTFHVKGAVWSDSEEFIAVWGREVGASRDDLRIYMSPSYEINDTIVPRDEVPLVTIDSVRFIGYDEILAVGGRDTNGTSHLLIFEVGPLSLLKDYVSLKNVRILSIHSDTRDLIFVDSTGGVLVFNTTYWTPAERFDTLSGEPTCVSIDVPQTTAWIVGDENGMMTIWRYELRPFLNISLDRGPVQGVSFGHDKHYRLIYAMPSGDGGSRIQTRFVCFELGNVSDEVVTESPVTWMVPDPLVEGGIVVGFEDGSLRTYWIELVEPPGPSKPSDDNGSFGIGLPAGIAINVALLIGVVYLIVRYRKRARQG